jgi:uncharacterized protein YjeT (DUF2065 family)
MVWQEMSDGLAGNVEEHLRLIGSVIFAAIV